MNTNRVLSKWIYQHILFILFKCCQNGLASNLLKGSLFIGITWHNLTWSPHLYMETTTIPSWTVYNHPYVTFIKKVKQLSKYTMIIESKYTIYRGCILGCTIHNAISDIIPYIWVIQEIPVSKANGYTYISLFVAP